MQVTQSCHFEFNHYHGRFRHKVFSSEEFSPTTLQGFEAGVGLNRGRPGRVRINPPESMTLAESLGW